jgi:hypothetical protein
LSEQHVALAVHVAPVAPQPAYAQVPPTQRREQQSASAAQVSSPVLRHAVAHVPATQFWLQQSLASVQLTGSVQKKMTGVQNPVHATHVPDSQRFPPQHGWLALQL